MTRKIRSALISVYHKDNLVPVLDVLSKNNVQLYSTGGTLSFIEEQGLSAIAVENLTNYPSIFGGRVKTLHPKIFGGILFRRGDEGDVAQADEYEIPAIDLVVVDLYPFIETIASGATDDEIIEKIDIGGISLIRAAAKNFNDVVTISSQEQYGELIDLITNQNCSSTHVDRKLFATKAFKVSSRYDLAIFNYFNSNNSIPGLHINETNSSVLRYGENPHQEARFLGDLKALFIQKNGKALSYNNLVDIHAGLHLISEFGDQHVFAILKHTNACGVALDDNVKNAYAKALEADTLSAFGGILVTNCSVTLEAAEQMHNLFFEVLIAPDIEPKAYDILKQKKNRILLIQKDHYEANKVTKTLLNGFIEQDEDLHTDSLEDLKFVTKTTPSSEDLHTLLFASKICKHTKSNAIVLAKNGQMLASGVGQTSRIDALNQAIAKARQFGFDLNGSSMASDAFFPFPDCVEVANKAGITSVIQPGGSLKDQLSIDYCDKHGMAMTFTGYRHFKH